MNTFRRTRACVLGLAALAVSAHAQNLTCATALSQLQGYVHQVNMAATLEYQQGIPAKCGPNPYCAQTLFAQLNAWYMQQAAMVQNWYTQIGATCAGGQTQRIRVGDAQHPIDEDDIEDLEMDKEVSDKPVRLRIPSSPSGYRSQRRR